MSENLNAKTYPDQSALKLHSSMQYGEPMASAALNKSHHNVYAHGIYEGFDYVLAGGLSVVIAGTGDQHTLVTRHNDVTLTIHALHPMQFILPVGGAVAIIVDSFYQYGVQTKQVNADSIIEAAEYKVLPLDQVLPKHVVIVEFDIPAGTTELNDTMINLEARQGAGVGVKTHEKAYHPHKQYERVDNAATDADIDATATSKKHVKLPQLWRGIAKKITAAFLGRRVNTTGSLKGGGNLSGDLNLSIEDATTDQKGVSQLTDSVSTSSSILSATAKAVKTAYDKAVSAYNLAASKWTYVTATTDRHGAVQLTDSNRTVSSVLGATATAVKNTYDMAAAKWTYVTATTSRSGAVQLTDSVATSSSILASTAKAVKTAYDKGVSALNVANSKWAYVTAHATRFGGVKLDDAVNSSNDESSGFAATPTAVKAAYDKAILAYNLAASKWVYVTATTSRSGAVQLTDSVATSSSILAGTAKAVKTAYDKGVSALNVANSKWAYVTAHATRFGGVKLDDAVNSSNDESSGFAATPTAVKAAYDKAVSALNVANGKWSLKAASRTVQGAVQLSDSINLVSSLLAATPTAVKAAYDKAVSAYNLAASKWAYVTATTSRSGAVQLSDSVSSTSSVLAATAKAVRSAYNLAASKMTQATADGRYLGKTATPANSDKVDGYHASSLLGGRDLGKIAGNLKPTSYNNDYVSNIQGYNQSWPTTYGNTVNFGGAGSSLAQIYVDWNASPTGDSASPTGNQGGAWIRSCRENANRFTNWARLYTTHYKPSKADVGLSDVNNWSATTSVSDSSTTKYSTASAVRSAYNKGVSAYNLAATKMTQGTADGRYLAKTAKSSDSNSLDGLDLHTGRNNEKNKVVRTNASGYLDVGLFNTTSGATSTGTLFACFNSASDMYLRYMTATNTRAKLSVYSKAESDARRTKNTNTHRGCDNTPRNGQTAISISSNWAYDNVKTAVPAGAKFTDTNTHRSISNSVSSTSTSVSASLSAVRSAYNRGTDGINKANAAQTKANSAYTLASTLIKGAQGSGAPSSSQKPPVGGLFVRWD